MSDATDARAGDRGPFDDAALDRFQKMARMDRPYQGINDRHVFDSRLTGQNPPPVHFSTQEGERERYFSLKFQYFLAKLTRLFPETAFAWQGPREVSVVLPDSLTDLWDEIFAAECKAYILRATQSPEDAVVAAWYNDLAACQEWRRFLDAVSGTMSTSEIGSRISDLFPFSVEEERACFDQFSRVHRLAEETFETELTSASAISAYRTLHLDATMRRLTAEVAALFLDPEASFDDCVRLIVCLLATEYGARVCDYLSVTSRDRSERLELFASSYDPDIAKVRRGEYSYEYGAGITGSSFLLRSGEPYRWLGTNAIDRDPRAGPKHKHDYQQVYGSVRSFWVFPVFNGTRLEGVLRLIDRSERSPDSKDELADEDTWPYSTRAEVAYIADWFGSMVDVLRTAFGEGRDESAVTAISRVRRYVSFVDWIPIRYLGALVSQLTRLALMRSEHRTVGCMVAVGTRDVCKELLKEPRQIYMAVPDEKRRGPLEGASELFGRVLPGAGIFVCEIPADGAEMGVVSYSEVLATNKLSPEEVVDEFGAWSDLLLIYVDGDRDVLHIYESGVPLADYFLNEKTGTWQLHLFSLIDEVLEYVLPTGLSLDAVQAAVKSAVEFAYLGSGGLVVLANGSVERSVVSERGFRVDNLIARMDPRLFASIASVDGGTWVDATSGRVVEAGMLFLNSGDEDEGHIGGARHKAANFLWRKLEGALIVAVSANREVTLYANGRETPIVLSDIDVILRLVNEARGVRGIS